MKRENHASLDPPRGGVTVWGTQGKSFQRWRPEAGIAVTLILIIFFIKKSYYHGLSCERSHNNNKGLWADGLLETWFWGAGEDTEAWSGNTGKTGQEGISALLLWSLVSSAEESLAAEERLRPQRPAPCWSVVPVGCLCLNAGQPQRSNRSRWHESLPRD